MYTCEECGKKYTRKDSMLRHARTHAPDSQEEEEPVNKLNRMEEEKPIIEDGNWLREEILNITAYHFQMMSTTLVSAYREIHRAIVEAIQQQKIMNGYDVVDCDKQTDKAIETILKPSIANLQHHSRVEMIRIANMLKNEFTV